MDELPEWVKFEEVKPESQQEYGRGNRVRKQVSYVDDISEEQYQRGDDGVFFAVFFYPFRSIRRINLIEEVVEPDHKEVLKRIRVVRVGR
jgi:hypothetical protein